LFRATENWQPTFLQFWKSLVVRASCYESSWLRTYTLNFVGLPSRYMKHKLASEIVSEIQIHFELSGFCTLEIQVGWIKILLSNQILPQRSTKLNSFTVKCCMDQQDSNSAYASENMCNLLSITMPNIYAISSSLDKQTAKKL
jgi:hypothetical protein